MLTNSSKTDLESNPLLEHMNRLYSYARFLTRNGNEAEDLVQETYVRAIPAMEHLRPDSNVKAWLLTIMRNICFNQLRRWRAEPKVVYIDACEGSVYVLADPSPDPYERYINRLEHQRIRHAIVLLPVYLREVILLREYEELSYQEIANILGCPVGSVMSRLHRARSRLRKIMSNDFDPYILSQNDNLKGRAQNSEESFHPYHQDDLNRA
jgi:RNA polymerase sigma-70 factor, ECF subfamily